MLKNDPAEFDDMRERWWKPLHSLWKLDDPDWMAQRLSLWKKIEKNKNIEHFDKHKLRGYRNIFLTGRQYEKLYPYLSDDARYMRVSYWERLALTPFTEPSQYKLYMDQRAIKQNNDWGDMEITCLLITARIYKGTGLANDNVLNIYRHIMGGGRLEDNKVLLSKSIDNFERRMDEQLETYFRSLHRLLPGGSTTDPLSLEDYAWLLNLFDYYESIAEMLCEHSDLIRKKYYRGRKERQSAAEYERVLKFTYSYRKNWAVRLADFDKAQHVGSPQLDEVIGKTKELIHSDRFPAVYREIWQEFES